MPSDGFLEASVNYRRRTISNESTITGVWEAEGLGGCIQAISTSCRVPEEN